MPAISAIGSNTIIFWKNQIHIVIERHTSSIHLKTPHLMQLQKDYVPSDNGFVSQTPILILLAPSNSPPLIIANHAIESLMTIGPSWAILRTFSPIVSPTPLYKNTLSIILRCTLSILSLNIISELTLFMPRLRAHHLSDQHFDSVTPTFISPPHKRVYLRLYFPLSRCSVPALCPFEPYWNNSQLHRPASQSRFCLPFSRHFFVGCLSDLAIQQLPVLRAFRRDPTRSLIPVPT
jgi:hypothetical protein